MELNSISGISGISSAGVAETQRQFSSEVSRVETTDESPAQQPVDDSKGANLDVSA